MMEFNNQEHMELALSTNPPDLLITKQDTIELFCRRCVKWIRPDNYAGHECQPYLPGLKP